MAQSGAYDLKKFGNQSMVMINPNVKEIPKTYKQYKFFLMTHLKLNILKQISYFFFVIS